MDYVICQYSAHMSIKMKREKKVQTLNPGH